MQIGILESDDFSSKALAILGELGTVEKYNDGSVQEFLLDKEVLFIRLGHQINTELLKMVPRLKYLCSPTTGHNHIDMDELVNRSITLLSLQGERDFLMSIRATPEHTLGLVLALLRNYRQAFLSLGNNRWDRDSCRGYELYGNTVGIIGFGRVGYILNSYLQAFGAEVYYYDNDPNVVSDTASRCDDIDELVGSCSIIVLCASYSKDNGVLLQSLHMRLMSGKYFINTARGELVDEDALLDYIIRDHFAGVATDVIDSECGDNRLRQWLDAADGKNVIITPHIAGATYNSMHATEEFIVNKLKSEVVK